MKRKNEIDPLFGELIKQSRLSLRLTQEEIAEKVDCHPQYYKNLENGKGMPSIHTFCKIMRALNLSADLYVYPDKKREAPTKEEVVRLMSQMDEYALDVLLATATALVNEHHTNNE